MRTIPDERGDSATKVRASAPDIAMLWAAITVSLATAIVTLRLWDWTPGSPLGLDGDATFVSMQLKDIDENGWYWSNPDLNFPFGQSGYLFPELNVAHVAIVKILNLFFHDPFSGGVMYFVLGFPLATATMYWLARSQGIGIYGAFPAAVLFAHAPGHQERFEHFWLASYWVVPIAMWLVMETSHGRSLWSGRRRRWRTVLAIVLVGLSGVYYVAFTLILLAIVTIVRRVSGSVTDWLPGVPIMGGLLAVIAVPLLVARHASQDLLQTGDLPATRSFAESETFAGKITDLLLPWEGHIVEPLAYLSWAYDAVTTATVEETALGIVGALGLAGLTLLAFRRLLRGQPSSADGPGVWAALALVTTAFYTVGGLGSMTALFFTPQIRTWSRISIYILLLALLLVGWWITHLDRRAWGWPLAAGLLVTIVGVLDQTNPSRAPDHMAVANELDKVGRYTETLDAQVAPGCGVFQLPVVPFPESLPQEEMKRYEQIIPYLTDSQLKWSAGGMRGTTSAHWQLGINTSNVPQLLRDLAATDFCAIEVATRGFSPNNDPRPQLASILGDPIAATADQQFVTYRLPSYPGSRPRLLQPVLVSILGYPIETLDGSTVQQLGPTTMISVANMSDEQQEIAIAIHLRSIGAERRDMILRSGSEEIWRGTISGDLRTARFVLEVPPGMTRLSNEIGGMTYKSPSSDRLVAAEVVGVDAKLVADPGEVRVVAMFDQAASGWVSLK